MNISKLKLAWKFITGGREGLLDYALDVSNNFANKLPDAKKEDIKSYLSTANRILDTLNSLSWLCPSKWRQAYTLTVSAFADLVAALEDLKVTKDELKYVCDAYRIAYASWRAE